MFRAWGAIPFANPRARSLFLLVSLSVAGLLTSPATTRAEEAGTAASNKQIVRDFYEAGLNRKDFAAASAFLGPKYIQHNPMAKDGPEGFAKFIAFLRDKYPNSRSEVKQAFADGDYVILHVLEKLRPEDRGNAIVDIFRLEHGKIVEHWDVKQSIPATTANSNGMF